MTTSFISIIVPEAGCILGWAPGASYRAARNEQLPGWVRIGRRLIVIAPTFWKAFGIDEPGRIELAADEVREAALRR